METTYLLCSKTAWVGGRCESRASSRVQNLVGGFAKAAAICSGSAQHRTTVAPVFFQRASGTAATLDTERWTLIWQTQAGYASGHKSGNVGAGEWAINN